MADEAVKTAAPLAHWRYECRPAEVVCALANDRMHLLIVLERRGGDRFPDVREVESWLREWLKRPATAEGLAVECATRWKCKATVRGSAASHGDIVAVCEGG